MLLLLLLNKFPKFHIWDGFCPANICQFKSNRNIRKRCQIYSKVTIKNDKVTPLALFWCLYCIVEFEQILHLFVVFRLLFLRCMFYWVPFKIDEDTRTCTVHCFSVFIIVYFSYWVRFLSDSAFQKCFKKQHCKPFLWIF